MSPDVEAVIDHASARRFTFRELNGRANRFAALASARGVKPGDRVALLLLNGVEYTEAFYGLAKIGAVVVPLNWRLVPDELSYILKNAGATMLIYSEAFQDVTSTLHAMGANGSDIEHWIEISPAPNRLPFAEHYDSLLDAASQEEPKHAGSDDDLLFIMYTSGTTGLPKGVVHTHSTVAWSLFTIAATADTRYMDRYAIALPLFHVGALTPLLGNVYAGITSVLLQQFDPTVMWEVIERERITITLAVPAMLNFMLAVPAFKTTDYSSLRWIMSGATPVPVTLIERYAAINIEIHQVYGLTESGGPGCLISPDQALQHIGSTGKAFFHTDVRVVTPEGRDVEPGEPGEVIIRGRHIMKEYWNNPRPPRRPFATAGCTLGTSRSSMPMVSSPFTIASKTWSYQGAKMCILQRSKTFCLVTRMSLKPQSSASPASVGVSLRLRLLSAPMQR